METLLPCYGGRAPFLVLSVCWSMGPTKGFISVSPQRREGDQTTELWPQCWPRLSKQAGELPVPQGAPAPTM